MNDAEKDIQPDEEDTEPVFDPNEREDIETLYQLVREMLRKIDRDIMEKAKRVMPYACYQLFSEAEATLLDVFYAVGQLRSTYRIYTMKCSEQYELHVRMAERRDE